MEEGNNEVKSFLDLIVDKISLKDHKEWRNLMVVLPNLRACRILEAKLAKYIAAEIKKPVFAPEIIDINNFIKRLSPIEKLDDIALIGRLYNVYENILTSKGENADFNYMMGWASTFISDIGDIDKHYDSTRRDDGETIFKRLYSAKEFEIHFGKDPEDINVDIPIWNLCYAILPDLYVKFREILLEKNEGYDGLIYRDCAENIGKYAAKLQHDSYIFAGFHALSPAELEILKYFKDNYDTQFYFDIDPFYCDVKKEDAEDKFSTSYFLKKTSEKLDLQLDKLEFTNENYTSQHKTIDIVGVSHKMSQIFYAIQELNKIQEKQGNLDNTALVLADESLLLPFCSAYDCKDANITMGVSIRTLPAFSLMTDLLDCYRPDLNETKDKDKFLNGFRHRDLMALLRHPLFTKAFVFKQPSEDETATDEKQTKQDDIAKQIANLDKSPSPIISVEDLSFLPEDARLKTIGEKDNVYEAVLHYLEKICLRLSTAYKHDSQILQAVINELKNMDSSVINLIQGGKVRYYGLRALMINAVNFNINMSGDEQKGLQIMGMLETRALDFKNVIMLSVNEGTVPTKINFTTLVPYDFHYEDCRLEKYLYNDQVSAYHFFRLLQRASHAVLIFDNDSSNEVAEKSRFIRQLEFKIKEKNLNNIELHYPKASIPFTVDTAGITVEKTDAVLQALYKYKYSATGLQSYVQCPLKFYLQYICGIKEPDTYEDTIGQNVIGSAAHKVFEIVFQNIKDNPCGYKQIIKDYLAEIQKMKDEDARTLVESKVKYIAVCWIEGLVESLKMFYRKKAAAFPDDDLKDFLKDYFAKQLPENEANALIDILLQYLTKEKFQLDQEKLTYDLINHLLTDHIGAMTDYIIKDLGYEENGNNEKKPEKVKDLVEYIVNLYFIEHEHYKVEDLGKGRLFLARQIVLKDVRNYLQKVLENDNFKGLENDNLQILGLELKPDVKISVQTIDKTNHSKTVDLNLYGSLDRLQKKDGVVEILDYKTGSVYNLIFKNKNADLTKELGILMGYESATPKEEQAISQTVKDQFVDMLVDALHDSDNKQFLQLLFYALLYHLMDIDSGAEQIKPSSEWKARCGLISLPKCNAGEEKYWDFVTMDLGKIEYPPVVESNAKGKPKKPKKVPSKEVKDSILSSENIVYIEKAFIKLLAEIIDPKKPFIQAQDKKDCKYCDFQALCGRKTPDTPY